MIWVGFGLLAEKVITEVEDGKSCKWLSSCIYMLIPQSGHGRRIQVTEQLALLSSNHEVLGSDLIIGGVQLLTTEHFISLLLSALIVDIT